MTKTAMFYKDIQSTGHLFEKKTNTKFRNHKYKYSQKIKVRLSIVSLIIENLMMKRTGTCTIIKLIVELDFILLFS